MLKELSRNKITPLDRFSLFPGSRYMGSKTKIIGDIWAILSEYPFQSFYDAFAGSNVVAYFMKCQGKQVYTNDFMNISHNAAKALIENQAIQVDEADMERLLQPVVTNGFVTRNFAGLYFSDEDNILLDTIRCNADLLENEYKRAIVIAALVRACMKKRPRGIFTFVGHRYDDGRADIKKTMLDHFLENIAAFNMAIFDNGSLCKAYNLQTEEFKLTTDLVYFDPPYFTPNSDNDYVRRYHFVEGLCRNWDGLSIQEHTLTKKFKSYPSPFANKRAAYAAFEQLFYNFKDSKLAVSYSSNSLPNKVELTAILKNYKDNVVVHEIDHLYSFGNQQNRVGNNANRVKEYLFVAY